MRRRPTLVLASLSLCATMIARESLAQTVGDIARRGICDSMPTNGLQMQIVATHRCLYPAELSDFRAGAGITFVGNVLPALHASTADLLRRAAMRAPIQMTSGYRTIAGQYVLTRSSDPSCMTPAVVGSSPHHTGRAIDASNYGAIRSAMMSVGCEQSYPTSDPVHFNCPGWTDNTIKAHSILAFQRLWNVNNPTMRIVEDGSYGAQTEGVLVRSPAAGFAIADGCPRNAPPRGAVDAADCTAVAGWAQDPDTPTRAIDVHLYVDSTPGAPGARMFAITARDARADLCMPLGSCEHAFTWPIPAMLRDGAPHTIRAYAIDSAGGANAAIGAARTITCSASTQDVVSLDATSPEADGGADSASDAPLDDVPSDSAAADAGDAGGEIEYVRLSDGALVPVDSLPGCRCAAPGGASSRPRAWWALVSALALAVTRRRQLRGS